MSLTLKQGDNDFEKLEKGENTPAEEPTESLADLASSNDDDDKLPF